MIILAGIAVAKLSEIKIFRYDQEGIEVEAHYQIDRKEKILVIHNYTIYYDNKTIEDINQVFKRINNTKYTIEMVG